MVEAVIKAEKRDIKGKGAVHEMRRLGRIPGVVYGQGRQAESVAVDARAFSRFLSSEAASRVFTLQLGTSGLPVLLKEVQRHPLTGAVRHADFYAVNLDEPVHTVVPLHFVGEEKRAADGGVLQHGLRQLEIRCLPGKIPERVEIDLSGLKLGDNLTVAEIELGEGVEILTPAEDVVASVISTRVAAGDEAGEAAGTGGTEGAAAEGAAAGTAGTAKGGA